MRPETSSPRSRRGDIGGEINVRSSKKGMRAPGSALSSDDQARVTAASCWRRLRRGTPPSVARDQKLNLRASSMRRAGMAELARPKKGDVSTPL